MYEGRLYYIEYPGACPVNREGISMHTPIGRLESDSWTGRPEYHTVLSWLIRVSAPPAPADRGGAGRLPAAAGI